MRIFHLRRRTSSTTLCQTLYLLTIRLWLNLRPTSTKNDRPIYALHICPFGTFDRCEAVSPFLQASLKPWGHQSYFFLKDYLLFFCEMVWLFSGVGMLNELGMTSERKHICRDPLREYGSALLMVHMAYKEAKLMLAGFVILDGIAGPLLSLSHARSSWYAHGMSCPEGGEAVQIRDFYSFW